MCVRRSLSFLQRQPKVNDGVTARKTVSLETVHNRQISPTANGGGGGTRNCSLATDSATCALSNLGFVFRLCLVVLNPLLLFV